MPDVRVLIAAAGRGSRSGLPFPKTLFPIQGMPILVRIARLLGTYDCCPTIIVSPEGRQPIDQCLSESELAAELVVQPEPFGMGDAVLRFAGSSAFAAAEHVILVWGDIPFLQSETVAAVVERHCVNANDFTFATRQVDQAYTLVERDAQGRVSRVTESREQGVGAPGAGEREIGLFVFRTQAVLDTLREDLPGKWGKVTGEHGFLYVIGHLVDRGFRVEALPVATELDLVSLNRMKDIDAFL